MQSQPKLDLVFVVDATGSMGSYIKSAQKNINKIMETIAAAESRDVRFGLVCYRDHQSSEEYCKKTFQFTKSVSKAKKYVDTMSAGGGGDAPEAMAAALNAAVTELDWRKEALKIVCLIADAPPHGLIKKARDDYPQGCPEGCDPHALVLESMLRQEMILYAIACEPAVSGYQGLPQWLKAISESTGGRYVPLGNASMLPQLIIGGAQEEFDLERLEHQVDEEAKAVYEELGSDIDEETLHKNVWSNLSAKGVCVNSVTVESNETQLTEEQKKKEREIIEHLKELSTLAEVKEYLGALSPADFPVSRRSFRTRGSPSGASFSFGASAASSPPSAPSSNPSFSWTKQSVSSARSPCTAKQVSRLMHRKKHAGKSKNY